MEQKDEVSRLRLRESWVLKVLGSRPIFQAVMKLGWLNRVERFPEGICVFYHATFQEYFAALAVEDWDYFLPRNHVDCPVEGKEYRIFEPQWKQIILLWLGRGDVVDEKKEGFIEKLVNFDDGCGDFYKYQAYFISAAAINEFKVCSLAGEIVGQVVKWGFGYFNIEKQEWWTCLDPIKKGARKAIPETIQPLAISEVRTIIANCPEKYTPSSLKRENLLGMEPANPEAIMVFMNKINNSKHTDNLESIGQGNSQAINALVKLIDNTNDEKKRRQVAESLGKIGQGNSQAINALVKLIGNTKKSHTHRIIAENLGTINPGNDIAISTLIELIENGSNSYIVHEAMLSLQKIGSGNIQAIEKLANVININQDKEDIVRRAILALEEIGKSNIQAINLLIKLIVNIKNEKTFVLLVMSLENLVTSLGDLQSQTPQINEVLVKLIQNTKNEEALISLATILSKTDPGNTQAIEVLNKLIENTKDESNFILLARRLVEIDPENPRIIDALLTIIGNWKNEHINPSFICEVARNEQLKYKAINAFISLAENTQNEKTLRLLATILAEIDPKSHNVIDALLKIIKISRSEYTCGFVAEKIGEIAPGNLQAINVLIECIKNTTDEQNRAWMAVNLGEIAAKNKQAIDVVTMVLESTTEIWAWHRIAYTLAAIGKDNSSVISTFVRIMRTTHNPTMRMGAVNALGKIAPGNWEAIMELVLVLKYGKNMKTKISTRARTSQSLINILTTPEQYAGVVNALKDCLSDEVYHNNFERFDECYEVIWNCAENLPYPDFYRAWHGLTETQTSPLI